MIYIKVKPYNINKIALKDVHSSITYKELEVKTKELCNIINDIIDYNTTHIIGVIGDRNLHLPIIYLSILQTNNYFMPINMRFPSIKKKYILDDALPTIIISANQIFEQEYIFVCEYYNYFIYTRKNIVRIINSKDENSGYCIYTSGTTGNPKGVLIGYTSLINTIECFKNIYNLETNSVFLALSNISFDISILELLLPLYSGSTLIISSYRAQIDMNELRRIISSEKITHLQATPSTWNMLEKSGWKNKEDISIITGGERLSNELAQRLLCLTDRFHNVYGPTEATIWCASKEITINNVDSEISLGKPIENVEFRIIDKNNSIVKNNDIGELIISGKCLAQRYLGNKKLKVNILNDKTIDIYKTGDLVYRDQNGDYYFKGRIDNQIKKNGYRIELDEIEYHLLKINEINQAASFFINDIIYAVISLNKEISKTNIFKSLREVLPSYSIPQRIIILDKLPINDNFKVDRNKILKKIKMEG